MRLTCKLKFDWNSTSHWSGARKSREIECGNPSNQSLNPPNGHIPTNSNGRVTILGPLLVILVAWA